MGYNGNGNCVFFSALLGTAILLCLLFIIGVPKFVIALEYWSRCPRFPLIPVYLCISGLLGVACVAHSAFLWSCLYRRRMMKKTSHDSCLILWVILMLTVAVSQLIGSPLIIYQHHHMSSNMTGCDVTDGLFPSPNVKQSNFNQSASSFHTNVFNVSMKKSDNFTEYVANPDAKAQNRTSSKYSSGVCLNCSDVVMTCAYVTAVIEIVFMAVPIICLVIASVVFRLRNSDKLESK